MGKPTYDVTGEEVKMAKSFVISSKLEPFYTGGSLLLSLDQSHLICQCEDNVKIVDISTGQTVKSIVSEEDVVTGLCADNQQLFTAHRASLLIKQWQWREPAQLPTRSWKAHSVPVTALTMDPSSALLVSGATDGLIRVWDIEQSFCTHQLKGSKGVITLLSFHPDELYVVSTADDLLIRVWDLNTSACIHTFKGHVSPATSFTFLDSSTLVTGGRDKVLNTWSLADGKLKSTVPVYEVLEDTALCDTNIVTAGDKGVLRSWSGGKCVLEQASPPLPRQFTHLLPYKEGLIAVTFDHNIIIFNKQLESVKHFIGYNDEILDIKDAGEQHIAMATNSEQIRLVDRASLSTEIITGHTDTVLSIDTQVEHSLLVSGSKDHSVKVWCKEGSTYQCVATCTGHTGAVSGVAWCQHAENVFFVSVGVDMTLKLWQSPGVGAWSNFKCVYTQKAHDKDINCCVVSPNDQLVVTGSLDKTARVWRASNGGLQGTLRGHKRGVWCARFSPVDQCVLTASGDTMLKLWRLSDYSCIRTFEGHSASVLNCSFITHGKQIVSTGADGLAKVWDTQSAECVTTLDGHSDKVWALCVKDGMLLTGAADSLLCMWTDVTQEEEEKEILEEQVNAEQHQKLNNLLHKKHYPEAFKLSLALAMPFKCLGVAERMLVDPSGPAQLAQILEELAVDELEVLLSYIATWNTNSKHTITSQTVLHSLLSGKRGLTLSTLPTLRQHWEALIPYTERHLERLTRLQQQATFLQYTWDRIKLNEM